MHWFPHFEKKIFFLKKKREWFPHFGGAEFYSSDLVAFVRWKEKLRQLKRSLLRTSLIDW